MSNSKREGGGGGVIVLDVTLKWEEIILYVTLKGDVR
jgi:hypothetical protein